MQLDEEAQMEEMMQIPVKLKIYIYILKEKTAQYLKFLTAKC